MTDVQQAVPVAQIDWRLIATAAGEHGVRYRTNTALLAFLAAAVPGLPCKSGEGAGARIAKWRTASVALGSWLSAALDDPNVCDAMKADINAWFSAGEPFAALASDATQTREAETWVPRIGDPVKVSDSCEHSADWQRTDLWVTGVAVDERCRGINVTVTEQWPVPHRFVGRDYMGHTDGFLVARTDGKPDDLEPRAALNVRDAA